MKKMKTERIFQMDRMVDIDDKPTTDNGWKRSERWKQLINQQTNKMSLHFNILTILLFVCLFVLWMMLMY